MVAHRLKQPTRRLGGPPQRLPIWPCSGWGLPAAAVAGAAVRSYRTISPLPVPTPWRGLATRLRAWPVPSKFAAFATRMRLSPHPLEGRTLPLTRQSPGHRRYVSVALSVALGRELASPAYSAQVLPGILPCGARTFLCAVNRAAAVWPTPGRQYRRRWGLKRTLRTPPTHPRVRSWGRGRACAWRARVPAGKDARRAERGPARPGHG